MKDRLSRCNQNKWKEVAPHITHLMCSSVLLLTISLQLVAASYSLCLPSLVVFISLLSYALHSQFYRNLVKWILRNFKDPARVGLVFLKKIIIFWRFQNGSINLFRITSEESWFLVFEIMLLKMFILTKNFRECRNWACLSV